MFIKTRSLFTGTSYRSECIQRASLSRVTCHESVRARVTAASVTTSARPQLSLVSPAPLHPSFFRHVQYSTWMLYVPDRWMQYLGSKYFLFDTNIFSRYIFIEMKAENHFALHYFQFTFAIL